MAYHAHKVHFSNIALYVKYQSLIILFWCWHNRCIEDRQSSCVFRKFQSLRRILRADSSSTRAPSRLVLAKVDHFLMWRFQPPSRAAWVSGVARAASVASAASVVSAASVASAASAACAASVASAACARNRNFECFYFKRRSNSVNRKCPSDRIKWYFSAKYLVEQYPGLEKWAPALKPTLVEPFSRSVGHSTNH